MNATTEDVEGEAAEGPLSIDGASGGAAVGGGGGGCCHDRRSSATNFEKKESVQNADNDEKQSVKDNNTIRNNYSCLTISVYSAIVIAVVCAFLVLGRDYIKYVLLALEKSNLWTSLVIFSLLFTVVSFPFTWGYILLNIACGYLYGLLLGIVVVVTCALCGVTAAHLFIKSLFQDFVSDHMTNDSMRAILRVVDSEHGFQVVVLARLTPIPFGLQNALFAMSKMSLQRYIAASVTGMLPTQGLNTYFGSTLRSMEEVISTSSGSSSAYVVFGAQLLMVGVLLMFVVQKARLAFDRTLLLRTESKELTAAGLDDCQSCLVNIEPREISQFLNSSHLSLNSYCVLIQERRESRTPRNSFPIQIYHNPNFII